MFIIVIPLFSQIRRNFDPNVGQESVKWQKGRSLHSAWDSATALVKTLLEQSSIWPPVRSSGILSCLSVQEYHKARWRWKTDSILRLGAEDCFSMSFRQVNDAMSKVVSKLHQDHI